MKTFGRFALRTGVFCGLLAIFWGCSSAKKAGKADEQDYGPRIKWYAHCETCKWCRGAFKTTQEAQRVVSEHNIKLHDWIKVAYYDQNECKK